MSHLVPVYAPDGEMFEVRPEQVGQLVLNEGWSQHKAETVEVEPAPAPLVFDEVDETPAAPRGRGKASSLVEPDPIEDDEDEAGNDDA